MRIAHFSQLFVVLLVFCLTTQAARTQAKPKERQSDPQTLKLRLPMKVLERSLRSNQHREFAMPNLQKFKTSYPEHTEIVANKKGTEFTVVMNNFQLSLGGKAQHAEIYEIRHRIALEPVKSQFILDVNPFAQRFVSKSFEIETSHKDSETEKDEEKLINLYLEEFNNQQTKINEDEENNWFTLERQDDLRYMAGDVLKHLAKFTSSITVKPQQLQFNFDLERYLHYLLQEKHEEVVNDYLKDFNSERLHKSKSCNFTPYAVNFKESRDEFNEQIKSIQNVKSEFSNSFGGTLQFIIQQNAVKLLMAFTSSLKVEPGLQASSVEELWMMISDSVTSLPTFPKLKMDLLEGFAPDLVGRYGRESIFDLSLVTNRQKMLKRAEIDGQFGFALDHKGNFKIKFPIGVDGKLGPNGICSAWQQERNLQFVLLITGKALVKSGDVTFFPIFKVSDTKMLDQAGEEILWFEDAAFKLSVEAGIQQVFDEFKDNLPLLELRLDHKLDLNDEMHSPGIFPVFGKGWIELNQRVNNLHQLQKFVKVPVPKHTFTLETVKNSGFKKKEDL